MVRLIRQTLEGSEVQDGVHRLMGFDNQGVVHDTGDRILRSIHPEFEQSVRQLLAKSESLGLVDMGVVPTRVENAKPLVLEHQRYRVTYPHEWPAEMLREACLFHLDLFQRLQRVGLDLKDGLPQNVLFEGASPRFIDFLSLVEGGSLDELPWLAAIRRNGEDLRSTVLWNMFVPYFVTPLVAMELAQFELARSMLSDQACNVGTSPPTLLQVRTRASLRDWLRWRLRVHQLSAPERISPERAYRRLEQLVKRITFPAPGGYSTYYADKNEEFALDDTASWLTKQRTVARILDEHRPRSALDLGCNTGWFSRLASSRGVDVVAIDIDEASLNKLFLTAQREGLAITPLRLAYADLHTETRVQGDRHTGEVFFEPAIGRLRSDMVLVLGLLHHLTLGEGRSFEDVMGTLSALTHETLVVEFVDLADPLVAGNPGYFARLGEWTTDNYNLERLVSAAAPDFEVLSVDQSHPTSRRILTLRRRHAEPTRREAREVPAAIRGSRTSP